MKRFYAFLYLLVLFSITGCSSSAVIQALSDKSTNLVFDLDTGDRITQILSQYLESDYFSPAGQSGRDNTPALFTKDNAALLEKSFAGSVFDGARVSALSSTKINVRTTLPSGKLTKEFISCTENSLTVTLSPVSMKSLVSTMSDDMKDIIDLFMAPVFDGTKMTRDEYKKLVSSVYGKELADELDRSKFNLVLSCPESEHIIKSMANAPADAILNTKKNSKRTTFTLSFIEFLTMEREESFTIYW